jgi:PTS system galactitol-specific IIC component
MMPIVIFILAIAFRQPIGRSLRHSIMIGVAFIGIFAVLGATLGIIGPAVQDLSQVIGAGTLGTDIGWPLTSAIAWGFWWSALMIPIGFAINWILLAIGWTKTFDADLWNYWHWVFTAAMCYIWTNNLLLSFGVSILTEVIILKLADWTAPWAQKFFGIPGCSLPHTETVNWAPINMAIEKAILSRFKKLDEFKADVDTIREKLGYWGDPIMLGFYVGILLGVVVWAVTGGSALIILKLGIYIAALLYLEGRLVGILIEGLVPITNGIRDFFQKTKRFKGREILIGIDGGPIGLACPSAVVVGTIGILIYVILTPIPAFKVLPLADLAIVPLFYMWAAAASKGNLVKTFINGTITSIIVLALTTSFAGPLTEAAKIIGFELPAGVVLASSLDAGAHILPWIIMMPLVGLMTGQTWLVVVSVLIGLFYAGCWYYAKDMPRKLSEE